MCRRLLKDCLGYRFERCSHGHWEVVIGIKIQVRIIFKIILIKCYELLTQKLPLPSSLVLRKLIDRIWSIRKGILLA